MRNAEYILDQKVKRLCRGGKMSSLDACVQQAIALLLSNNRPWAHNLPMAYPASPPEVMMLLYQFFLCCSFCLEFSAL